MPRFGLNVFRSASLTPPDIALEYSVWPCLALFVWRSIQWIGKAVLFGFCFYVFACVACVSAWLRPYFQNYVLRFEVLGKRSLATRAT